MTRLQKSARLGRRPERQLHLIILHLIRIGPPHIRIGAGFAGRNVVEGLDPDTDAGAQGAEGITVAAEEMGASGHAGAYDGHVDFHRTVSPVSKNGYPERNETGGFQQKNIP